MGMPGYDRNTPEPEYGRSQNREYRNHVRKTDIDPIVAEEAKQTSVKLHCPARLAVASLLAD
jgi:hypothetical protein